MLLGLRFRRSPGRRRAATGGRQAPRSRRGPGSGAVAVGAGRRARRARHENRQDLAAGARRAGHENRQALAAGADEEPQGTRTATRNGRTAGIGGQRRRTGRSVDTDSKTDQAVATQTAEKADKPAADAKATPETKVDLATLKEMSIGELTKIAKSLD